MNQYAHLINTAADSLSKYLTAPLDSVLIVGSGLSSIGEGLNVVTEIAYKDIISIPVATAPTHEGALLICKFAGKTVAVCKGRVHLYEGYSAQQVAMLTYVLAGLGAKRLIVSNAAGALNSKYQPSDIMVIRDHINFTGQNPIIGQDDSLGQRFTDMSQAYYADLAKDVLKMGSALGLVMHSGIYAGVTGPSLETSAERRMLRQWGADAVGMSTVMEVIAANHCGMQVLGLSAITNLALGDADQQPDTIEQVLHHAQVAAKGIKKVVDAVLAN